MARRFTVLIGLVAALSGCDSGSDKTGVGGTTGGAGTIGINSGGGTGGIEAFCTTGCEKIGACNADAGVPVAGIVSACKTACHTNASPPGGLVCTNASEIGAASQACLQKSCDQIETCLADVPRCQGGLGGSGGGAGALGAAGTGGRGGAPGTGGGTASGWSCLEYTTGCVCTTSGSVGDSCTAIYTCCYTMGSGPGETCTCLKALDAATCLNTIPPTGGIVVGHCPPP